MSSSFCPDWGEPTELEEGDLRMEIAELEENIQILEGVLVRGEVGSPQEHDGVIASLQFFLEEQLARKLRLENPVVPQDLI